MSGHVDLDAVAPLDEERSSMQIAWLQKRAQGCRMLDAGCGAGRVAAPLAKAGIDVIAIDSDQEMVRRCKEAAPGATCMHGDMRKPQLLAASVDLVCCLGNTFCLLHDVDDALKTMRTWRCLLRGGGAIVIDDVPQDLWGELTEGNWTSGTSEDGRQLVWADDDAVFALRQQVDTARTVPDEQDRRCRLWTMGALTLLATAAGAGLPRHEPEGAVIVFSDASP